MSVFRYPGGKTKLLWQIRPQIDLLIRNGAVEYHEPCVGGGAVMQSVAKDFPGLQLHINDYDPEIFAFWNTVANGTGGELERLFELIRQIPTVELFRQLRREKTSDIVEMAYRAVFFNRTTFSGIHMSGPLGGYDQSRQYKITDRYLATRIIRDIQRVRFLLQGRTVVTQASVINYMQDMVPDNAVVFIDPPYVIQGNALYPTGMSLYEHHALAQVLKTKSNWILSYDRCPAVMEMYDFATRLLVPVKYSVTDYGTKRGTQYEYLILPKDMPLAAESASMVVETESDAAVIYVA